MSPEKACGIGFGTHKAATHAIHRIIETAQYGEHIQTTQEQRYFRLTLPTQHELMMRQARLCATAIMRDECPNFVYERTTDGYSIDERLH